MDEQYDLGRIERVDLRSVWPHEAINFTPWLAENIDLLNEHLRFDIDPDSIEREASAGGFSVDIVGDSATDQGEPGKVVIENQLAQTDHDHLGKLLTYLPPTKPMLSSGSQGRRAPSMPRRSNGSTTTPTLTLFCSKSKPSG